MERSRYFLLGAALAAATLPLPTFADDDEPSLKPLTMPMLVISGEKGGGDLLIKQAQLIGTDVQSAIVPGAGHWLMEEATDQVVPKLVDFLTR